jgi:hypothetical protein
MIEIKLIARNADHSMKYSLDDIGRWLDVNMPNPTMDLPQRWHLQIATDTICFEEDHDATLFALRWS